MTTSSSNIRRIFELALECQSPSERQQCLARECSGDGLLQAEVQSLLDQHDVGSSFLETPVVTADDLAYVGDLALTSPLVLDAEQAGTLIGPYKLLERIGTGGMGTVWMAEQQQPIRRKVALKLIKAGMDTRQVVARFEAERQALAMMDHPHIAKVLDGGSTPVGRPYFVMELVKGTPICQYCDENRLTMRQRLDLFMTVCDAIQHAHQKGIVHRDIKPSNVLIAPFDGRPVVKVIDFGVAKATGSDQLTERTLFTGFGSIVGTLEYMSPEQATLNNLDIDTRSDVYSLGVVLYELLAGSTPITRQQLTDTSLDEALKMIRERDPQRPSTRLHESQEILALIAALRQTDPQRLTSQLQGELDWIVMKAIEKDRARRYASASALAQDIERLLNDQPIEARPPSSAYLFRKFVRRNKVFVTAGSLILLVLIGGIIGTTWGLIEARRATGRARDAAAAERVATEKARTAEAHARAAAETERAATETAQVAEAQARNAEQEADKFGTFLIDRILSAARPKDDAGGLGMEVTVADAVQQAAEYASEDLQDHPRIESRARKAFGVMYRLRGEFPKAEEQLRLAVALAERGYGPDDPTTLNTRNSLGVVLQLMGRTEELIKTQQQLAESTERLLGKDDIQTITAWYNLAVYLAMANADNPRAIHILSDIYQRRKRVLGEDHPMTITTLVDLAEIMATEGQVSEAREQLERAVEKMNQAVGDDDGNTLAVTNRLADFYQRQGENDRAVELFERILPLERKVFGDLHQITVNTIGNLAIGYFQQGKLELGRELLDEWSQSRAKQLGADSVPYANALMKISQRLVPLKQYELAALLARQCLSILETTASDSPLIAEVQSILEQCEASQIRSTSQTESP